MLAKITSKNQLTLPKSITQAVGPAEYFDVQAREGQIVLTPVRIQRGDLEHKPVPSMLEGLSPRELQVLRLVAEGKTSKEIAVMLDLGLQTVRSYRKTMMKKLSVNNVASLTQLALSAGITRFGANGEASASGV